MTAETVLETRAILFDMDGTLIDSTAVVEGVWARFADRHGINVNTILETSHGRPMRATVTTWAPEDVDIDAECAELSSYEFAQTDGIVALPGATDFANSLPAQSIALVTSAARTLATARMELTGFTVPAVLVTADDVEHGKPDPACYLLAAKLVGVDPRDAIVFEDAEAGITSALAAGIRCVVVGDVEGDVTVGLPRIRNYSSLSFTVSEDSPADAAAPLEGSPAGRPLIRITL